jgi:hypothetical protein
MTNFDGESFVAGILLALVLSFILGSTMHNISENNRIIDCVKNTQYTVQICESIVKNKYTQER